MASCCSSSLGCPAPWRARAAAARYRRPAIPGPDDPPNMPLAQHGIEIPADRRGATHRCLMQQGTPTMTKGGPAAALVLRRVGSTAPVTMSWRSSSDTHRRLDNGVPACPWGRLESPSLSLPFPVWWRHERQQRSQLDGQGKGAGRVSL